MIIKRIRKLLSQREPPAAEIRPRIILRRTTDLEDEDSPWWLRIHSRAAGTMAKRRPQPLVRCPDGHRFAIAGGHSVDGATGEVNPRIGCPKCGWAALVRLAEWDPS